VNALTEKVQMKQSAIARLEADKHTPTQGNVRKVGFALGVYVELNAYYRKKLDQRCFLSKMYLKFLLNGL